MAIEFVSAENILSTFVDPAPEQLIKVPNERIVITVDFSNKLGVNEKVVSCKYGVSRVDNGVADSSIIETIQPGPEDRSIVFAIVGGRLGDVFRVYFVATKGLGGTINKVLLVRVEEPTGDFFAIPISVVGGETTVGADFSAEMDVSESVLDGQANMLLLSNRNVIATLIAGKDGRAGVLALITPSVVLEYPGEKFFVEILANTSKGNRFAKSVYLEVL